MKEANDFTSASQFAWTSERSRAAVALAEGKTQQEVADEVEVTRRTICNWLCEREFAAEVDRLSLMVDAASRAHRLRLTMRAIRQKIRDDVIDTDKDILDWLKFAQSETDGIKLSLTQLAALGETDSSVALSGPDRAGEDETAH